jgi:hypothetical protein
MVENEVEVVVLTPHLEMVLASHESEALTELKNEGAKMF